MTISAHNVTFIDLRDNPGPRPTPCHGAYIASFPPSIPVIEIHYKRGKPIPAICAWNVLQLCNSTSLFLKLAPITVEI
jgi:hypothetical protein